MTAEVAQKSSSFFPVGVKSQEESKTPMRRTALVSFPQTRQVLWDSDRIGTKIKLDLFPGRDITVKMSEKAIRLAYQHAAHEKGSQYHGFLVGMVETNAEEEGIEISLNRFDPGRDVPSGQGPVLTAKLPGDFAVPTCLSFLKGDGTLPHREADFLSAFKFLDHSASSRGEVELLNILSLRIHCLLYEGSEDITFSLHLGAVVAGTPFEVGQINPLPVIPTALARNLSGPVSISKLQKNHKFGYLTMDQTRKLLLLLDTDPKAYSLPLVGIWVSGVNYIHSPVVYAACLKYLFSKSIQDRATSPSGGFILLLYTPLNKQPLFFECQRRDNYHNLTFDLIGCKEQLHMYKHANSPAALNDVHLELTGARDGPSKELFLQALKKFEASSGSNNSKTTPGTTSDPHLQPRPSPKPTLTKSPSIMPSVPEVSLIFDNSENYIQVKRSSTSVEEARPGPLRDLNQSQSQLQMRAGFVTPQRRRFSASSGEGIGRSEQGIERRISRPSNNRKQEDAGPQLVGRKGKKKKVNSGKKSKARTEQKDTRDGSTDSGQETKNPNSNLPQMSYQVSEEDESNECRNSKQEDGLMKGRNGQQGEGITPEAYVPQNQSYPSAMPHQSLQFQGRIKRHQSDSDFRYSTSANVPLSGELISNGHVGYANSTTQRDENKHQSLPAHTSTEEPLRDRCLLQPPHHAADVVQAGLWSQPSEPSSQGHISQQQSPPAQQQRTQPSPPDQPRYQQRHRQLGKDFSDVGHENNKQMDPHQRDGLREESTFIQLKKQEKMIEQLQEQIKYLLQVQAGTISPGLLTPPATPPSGKGCPGFPFPTPDSPMEDRKPRSKTTHLQKDFGQTITNWESPLPKQVATISTNTGQSLFFPEPSPQLSPPEKTKRCSPNSSLGDDNSQHESPQQYPASPRSRETKSPSSSLGEDHRHTPTSRGSSARGSVSDAGLSTDPDFQVELENTNDDTHSLGKVEMRSFPDSGSSKSSPQSSPSRSHGQQNFSRTPQNSSPGSGDNTMVTSPPMPTLVSPVLGESASTCQPQMMHQQSWKKSSPSRMRQGFGWTDVIEEESEEGFSVTRERLQSPSLLHRDQKQFYQNLLGQVENFLQDDENDDCQGEMGNENSDEEEDDPDDDERSSETTDEETEEMLVHRDCGRSVLFSSPDVHPHINYVSLADFGLGPSDISIEADAIAMKYLSDEELAKISSEMKSEGGLRDGVNPLLRTVLTAGLPPRLLNDKSTIKSRVEFSFATRKYLEKHGLEDSVVRDDTQQRKKKKRKRKKRQKDEERIRKEEPKQQQQEEQQPEFERIFNYGGEIGQHQAHHRRSGEQAVFIGNILDLNKLKTLPKLL